MPTPTYVAGAQHTENINALQRKLEIHPEIYYLEDEKTPLLHLTWGKQGKDGLPLRREAVGNPEYKVLEKLPHERFTAINYSTGYTAGATTVVCDTVANIVVGMLLKAVLTGEIVYVSAKDGTAKTLTLVRGMGTTSAGTLADNCPLLVLGTANAENATRPNINRVKVSDRTNYTQIMREPIGSSDTLQNSDMVGPKSRTDLRREAWLAWKIRCETCFLHGEPFEDTTIEDEDGNPIRGTGGLIYWVDTVAGNVTTVATTLTKTIWTTFCRNLFTYGSSTKVVLCAPLIIEALDYWKDSKLEMKPDNRVYDLRVAEWATGNGTVLIMRDALLEDSPYGSGGYGGIAIGFEPDQCKYVYLKNRDVKLRTNIQDPSKDGWEDEVIGEVGLAIHNPEKCWMLEGVEEYS